MLKVVMDPPKPVYAAPVNASTERWGVYAIPKMWRLPDNRIVIRFNGIADLPSCPVCCPDLYFLSGDNGETWEGPQERSDIDLSIWGNVEPSMLRLRDGSTLCVHPVSGLVHPEAAPCRKRFPIPNSPKDLYWTFRQSDLTEREFRLERVRFSPDGQVTDVKPSRILFPEREIFYMGFVNGRVTENPINNHACAGNPFLSSIRELPDGTLLGLCTGQNPMVADHFCGEAYLMASSDDGLTWEKRSTITVNSAGYPYGLCGDGQEASLSVGPDGTLYCVTRTNMCVDHFREHSPMDTMLFISRDSGYTWEKEQPAADSSVTPHVIALKNGAVAILYGRPGVHMIVSEDGGKTFSGPFSIIGPTLREEIAEGKSWSESCRFDISYSNSFYVMLDDETFLLLYSDMAYDTGDGLKHKAGIVRRIRVSRQA